MDPETTGLAATAGTTLVTLLATDAWQGVRDGLVGLWRRARPDRADSIEDEWDASREELVSAQANGDAETEAELRADWQGRLRRLLVARPELAEELRSLLAEFTEDVPVPAPQMNLQATASGHSRVYQAGRDMQVEER